MGELTVVVSTDNRDGRFEDWVAHNAQILEGTRVVIVPWHNALADDKFRRIQELAEERDYLVCAGTHDTMFEANHNAGLRYAATHAVAPADQDLLAFLDDDIFLDPGWPQAIHRAAVAHAGCALGGVPKVVLDHFDHLR